MWGGDQLACIWLCPSVGVSVRRCVGASVVGVSVVSVRQSICLHICASVLVRAYSRALGDPSLLILPLCPQGDLGAFMCTATARADATARGVDDGRSPGSFPRKNPSAGHISMTAINAKRRPIISERNGSMQCTTKSYNSGLFYFRFRKSIVS